MLKLEILQQQQKFLITSFYKLVGDIAPIDIIPSKRKRKLNKFKIEDVMKPDMTTVKHITMQLMKLISEHISFIFLYNCVSVGSNATQTFSWEWHNFLEIGVHTLIIQDIFYMIFKSYN